MRLSIISALLAVAAPISSASHWDDAEKENFLLSAKIIDSSTIGTGITKPLRAT